MYMMNVMLNMLYIFEICKLLLQFINSKLKTEKDSNIKNIFYSFFVLYIMNLAL